MMNYQGNKEPPKLEGVKECDDCLLDIQPAVRDDMADECFQCCLDTGNQRWKAKGPAVLWNEENR